MKIIRTFFGNIRQHIFARRIRREIYGKIFPHLRQEADHGYPFGSDEEIARKNMGDFLTTGSTLRLLERAAIKMPRAEGNALRHIMHRDLQRVMWRYIEFAGDRMQPSEGDAQFIARRATV